MSDTDTPSGRLAALGIALPPLAVHSLPVKHVPIMMLLAVDIARVHCLTNMKEMFYRDP